LSVLERPDGIVQVRTAVLIAVLALVREFILVDIAHETPLAMLGLRIGARAARRVSAREQDPFSPRSSCFSP
jgi:hypothetical protein